MRTAYHVRSCHFICGANRPTGAFHATHQVDQDRDRRAADFQIRRSLLGRRVPGFGVKVTPKGRKVFIVLYRTAGAGSKPRKYTIGSYGRVTLHQARVAAQKVFAAKLEGRDPAAEKREARRRIVADRVEDLLETFIAQRLSQNRSGAEIARLLRREIGKTWAGRASTRLASAILLRSSPPSSSGARRSPPTRP